MTPLTPNEITKLIDESIALELHVAKLYEIFFKANAEDADFWWELHLEEKSHANLLRSVKESLLKQCDCFIHLVASSLEMLKTSNTVLLELIEKYTQTPPSRKEAFEVAIQVEMSAGEIHYDHFVNKKPANQLEIVFQQLNKDDKDHTKRIRDYFSQHLSSAE